MMIERAIPTPEDTAIFQRQLRRVLRECHGAALSQRETLGVVQRWTWDYMGLTPPGQVTL